MKKKLKAEIERNKDIVKEFEPLNEHGWQVVNIQNIGKDVYLTLKCTFDSHTESET